MCAREFLALATLWIESVEDELIVIPTRDNAGSAGVPRAIEGGGRVGRIFEDFFGSSALQRNPHEFNWNFARVRAFGDLLRPIENGGAVWSDYTVALFI